MFFPLKDYNPTRRTAYLTIFIIALNIAVFFYQSYFSSESQTIHIARSAMIPYEVTHYENITLQVIEPGRDSYLLAQRIQRDIDPFVSILTSMFMHGSLMHLLGNMLFLWIFGNNIEDFVGRFRFLLFYLACGVGASLIHILFNYNSLTPVIGASGAVSGVMGAYLVLYPRAKIRTLVFIFFLVTFVDVPASLFLVVWVIFQFFYATGQSNIAWLAHVGGFFIGLLLIKKYKKKRPVIEIIQ